MPSCMYFRTCFQHAENSTNWQLLASWGMWSPSRLFEVFQVADRLKVSMAELLTSPTAY